MGRSASGRRGGARLAERRWRRGCPWRLWRCRSRRRSRETRLRQRRRGGRWRRRRRLGAAKKMWLTREEKTSKGGGGVRGRAEAKSNSTWGSLGKFSCCDGTGWALFSAGYVRKRLNTFGAEEMAR